jgi:hypothetical protein
VLYTLCAMLFALCFPAYAQQQAKTAKIGWLGEGGAGSGREFFRQALAELGYLESKNLTTEYRYSEGKAERLPALADELIRLVTASGGAARVLKNATRSNAFTVTQYPLAASNQKYVAELAAKSRLLGIYPRGDYAASGGLMS